MPLVHMQRAIHPSRARLWPLGVVAISIVVALVSAVLAYGTVKPVAAASTHVFVDTASPSVVHRPDYPVSALIQRAELLGRVMTSPPVVEQIARRADVPAGTRSRLRLAPPPRASGVHGAGERGAGERDPDVRPPVSHRGRGAAVDPGPGHLHACAVDCLGCAARGCRGRRPGAAPARARRRRATPRARPGRAASARSGPWRGGERRHGGRHCRDHVPRRVRAGVRRPALPDPRADRAGPAIAPRIRGAGRVAAHDTAHAVDVRALPGDRLAGAVRRDPLEHTVADRPHLRPAGAPHRRRDVDARVADGGERGAATAADTDPCRGRRVRALRVRERDPQRRLAQPDPGAGRRAEAAPALGLLRVRVRHRVHRRAEQRGAAPSSPTRSCSR